MERAWGGDRLAKARRRSCVNGGGEPLDADARKGRGGRGAGALAHAAGLRPPTSDLRPLTSERRYAGRQALAASGRVFKGAGL